MRRLVFGLFTVLCLTAAAFAAAPLGPWAPVIEPPGIDATGGPDLYGYTWIDSNEPGGPVYNWKNISVTGTLVEGLGDDNYVGPFNIGFSFRYYWYDVTQYYIGSNGYLKFAPPFNMAQPFPATIPLTAAPNDFIAFYVADWYPGEPVGTGQCYRWNNADSLVVSYINLHPWVGPGVTDGAHTFQVIFSRLDSSITFQYGAQSGTVSNNDLLTGIENVNGQVGLLHSAVAYPTSNLAVYFNYPASTSYIVHDAGAMAAANDLSQGFFVLNNSAVSPYGKVKNVGNQAEAGFPVSCTIQQQGGGNVYNQSVTSNALTPGQEQAITFTPNWTPTAATQYFVNVQTNLTGDMNPNNNLKRAECHVMTLPGTMMYDDGTMEQAWSWQGGYGGMGTRFVPPSYPVDLDCVRFYMNGGGTSPFQAQVLDDNGPNGEPGTVLFQQNITSSAAGWYGATTNVSIASGAFYIAYMMVDSNTAALGVDSSSTQMGSRQTWEFTGVWSAFRNAENSDFMLRAKISQPGAVPNVSVTLIPYGTPIIIPLQGGSFSYNIATNNNEPTSQTYQGWGMLTLPNGNPYGPILGPVTLTIAPGASINRDRTQNIPGNAPSGNYLYNGYVGQYPNTVYDTESFPFTKSATGDGGPWVGEYANYGEPFDSEVPAVLPETFSLNGNHPNPFNPSTTISFALPEASQVTLTVYDVQGQVVTQLVNGWQNAGSHSVAFDGSNLASGIYVYRLTAGSFDATGKMVLMK